LQTGCPEVTITGCVRTQNKWICTILISLQIGRALSINVLQIPNYIVPHARLFILVAPSHILGFFLYFGLFNLFFIEIKMGYFSKRYCLKDVYVQGFLETRSIPKLCGL